MKQIIKFVKPFFLILLIMCSKGQQKRQPAVEGLFYSANKSELVSQLEKWKEVPTKYEDVLGIIAPHAGYMYSGNVAASGFSQIDPNKKIKTIFLIGRSHSGYFNGASVYSKGPFVNSLGEVDLDYEIIENLKKEKVFNIDENYHIQEHSLEVMLPFLQTYLKNKFKIVPILIGTENKETLDLIASKLVPYFIPDNLFVISTDLSHYPNYFDAKEADNKVIESILSKNAKTFLETVKHIENDTKYKNLSTAACGASAVYVFLKIIENKDNIELKKIKYANSGDVSGDMSRVVGYVSIIAYNKKNNSNNINYQESEAQIKFTDEEKKFLLQLARNSILSYLKGVELPPPKILPTSILNIKCGVFVSLYKNGELRGCIGTFSQEKPLWQNVIEMAKASAFNDYRFSPVSENELKDIKIEISVLTPLKRIKTIKEIEVGKHGIYIKKGFRSGTFLPQVGAKHNWTAEEFVSICARDKAGIGYNGWKSPDVELYTYEAIIFSEDDLKKNQ